MAFFLFLFLYRLSDLLEVCRWRHWQIVPWTSMRCTTLLQCNFFTNHWTICLKSFVHSENTGLVKMWIVAWLSHLISMSREILTTYLDRNCLIRYSSPVVWAINLYLVLTLDWAITNCFLLFQVTEFPSNKDTVSRCGMPIIWWSNPICI